MDPEIENQINNLHFQIKLSERAERFEDMVEFMTQRVKLNSKARLDEEGRNLLSISFKNLISNKRQALRQFSHHIYIQEDDSISQQLSPERFNQVLQDYQNQIRNELFETCLTCINLIDQFLIVDAEQENSWLSHQKYSENELEFMENLESLIFYYKLKGDYVRYVIEAFDGKESLEYLENSSKQFYLNLGQEAYQKAFDLANLPTSSATEPSESVISEKYLSPTNPLKLGVCLNFSVFCYDSLKQVDLAKDLAQTGFEQAINELDSLNDQEYMSSTTILQLIKDNLTLWNEPVEEPASGEEV